MLDQKPVSVIGGDFLDLAEKGLGESLEEGLQIASQYAQLFVSAEESSGLGLAKFLHGVNFRWSEFEVEEGDAFWKWSVRATGRSLATIQRRICTWEFLDGEYIPGQFRDAISNFSVKMLAKTYGICTRQLKNKSSGNYDFVPSGYEVEEEDWLALSECVDEAMVMEVVRGITGREKANRISFKIDDDGTLWAYRGQGSETIGQLFVKSKSILVRDAIAKLLEDANISERNEY